MTFAIRARVGAVALAMSLGLTAAAQDAARAPSLRTVVSDATAPAIDRGLRANDPPRGVRTSSLRALDRLGSAALPYLRGSIIVKFRPGTALAAQQSVLALVDGAAATTPTDANFDIVALDPDTDPEAAARRVAAQPDVEYAQARYRATPRFRPNDPFYSFQWNYPAIDMERAWDINPGAAASITVAVLDSGIAFRNTVIRFSSEPLSLGDLVIPSLGTVDVPFAAAPDLAGADRFVSPRDFIWGDAQPLDLDGHGTHVAGTIGQLTNNSLGVAGMAFNVRLMPVKVVGGFWDFYFGAPFEGTDDLIARGIRYAVDNGARIINMSIGREVGAPAFAIRDAVAYAVSRGAFVAVAGGNEFLEGNPAERYAEFAPDIDGMVAVAAVGRDRQRAIYSTAGPYIEVTAPGGDTTRGGAQAGILQQTYDFDLAWTFLDGPSRLRAPRFDSFVYLFAEGTSMATAHVAGFAALLMQQGITDPAAVEAVMKRFATDLGAAGRDDEHGHGLINPRAALRGMGLAR